MALIFRLKYNGEASWILAAHLAAHERKETAGRKYTLKGKRKTIPKHT